MPSAPARSLARQAPSRSLAAGAGTRDARGGTLARSGGKDARYPAPYPAGQAGQPYPRQPLALDPGYHSLGGPAPVVVIAKPSWARPGSVTAAAVMGFVVAAFCTFAAFFWFLIADVADDGKAMAHGLATIGIAMGYILGGVGTVSRQGWGRALLIGAAGFHILYGVYRVADSVVGMVNLVFIAMAVAIVALLSMPSASHYFAGKAPLGYE